MNLICVSMSLPSSLIMPQFEECENMKICFKLCMAVTEIHEMLFTVYRDDAVNKGDFQVVLKF